MFDVSSTAESCTEGLDALSCESRPQSVIFVKSCVLASLESSPLCDLIIRISSRPVQGRCRPYSAKLEILGDP